MTVAPSEPPGPTPPEPVPVAAAGTTKMAPATAPDATAPDAAPPTPPAVVRTPPATLRLVMLLLMLALVLVALFGYESLWPRHEVTTDDAQVDCHITPISARIHGYVTQVAVDDNTPVQKGRVMVRLDPRDCQAQLDQARAALDLAVASAESAQRKIPLTLETTRHDTSGAQARHQADTASWLRARVQEEQAATAQLLVARAAVEAKRAQQVRARNDLRRYEELVRQDVVTQSDYDAYKSAARVASADLEAALQQLRAAQQAVRMAREGTRTARAVMAQSRAEFLATAAREKQVPITQADYDSALAQVRKARAAVEQARLNLLYCNVEAPISGQVTQLSIQAGQYVTAGQLLFTLVPLERVYVTANFKETQLSKVRVGQRARLFVDTYGEDFYGVVESIAGAAGSRQALLPPQNATGNFIKVVQRIPVKILVRPLPRRQVLRPGMNVVATIYTD